MNDFKKHVFSHPTKQRIQKASLLQKTTAISQMIDKSRLVEGKSTENVAAYIKEKNDLHQEKDKIEQQIIDIKAKIEAKNES